MDLLVKRITRTANSTTGDFYVNGQKFCHTLEDVDRGLSSTMPLSDIMAKKVHGSTCIPTGRYKVVRAFSPKHGKDVPLLQNVPGFQGVEIHVGNYPKDTEGCLLLGNTIATDFVGESVAAIGKFYPLCFDALAKHEEVWITYQ